MEVASVTETTRRIVLERDTPEAAVSGLVEFIDRYYIRSRTRFIDTLSYRKTQIGTDFELFWILKPIGPEQESPLPVSLKRSKPAFELDFAGLSPKDNALEPLERRTTEEN